MRRIGYLAVLALIAAIVALAACNGPRHLKKGESLICPSCGAEFTLEEAQKYKENQQQR
ncbi:MAG: hypothetical protein R2940_16480 [Syntrophotaleaceae bacterium]